MRIIRYFSIALVLLAFAAPARADDISVTVNGNRLSLDQPPVTVSGRVLVPLRGIFEALGTSVHYDAAAHAIHAQRGTLAIDLTLNSTSAQVNGRSVALDVPAQIIGSRTLVPLRFVSETLGAAVKWDAASNSVAVTTGSAPSTSFAPPRPPPTIVVLPPARPHIDRVVDDMAGPLHIGDVLKVSMIGTPGGTATLDIGHFASAIPMTETAPGHYRAEFTVTPNAPVGAAPCDVSVHLMKNGLEADRKAPNPVAFGGQLGNVFVRVTSPLHGQKVMTNFVVSGETLPFATVTIRCGHRGEATGKANAQGHFEIPMHAGFYKGNHHEPLIVTATDSEGRISRKIQYDIAIGGE